MKLISNRCEVCRTKLGGEARMCEDCERSQREASLLELLSQFDDRQAASRRAEWMATAISKIAARTGDPGIAGALEASVRTRLATSA